MFVDTLVLRGDLSGDPSFRTCCCGRVPPPPARSPTPTCPSIYSSSRAPPRNLAINPVVQVLFELLPQPPDTVALPGLPSSPSAPTSSSPAVDLEFHVFEEPAGGRLTGQVVQPGAVRRASHRAAAGPVHARPRPRARQPGRSDLHDPATVAAAARPPVVPSNDTGRALPVDSLLVSLAAAAARNRLAPAVVDERVSLSYADLAAGQTGWPICSSAAACAPATWSDSASTGAPTWSSACSAS